MNEQELWQAVLAQVQFHISPANFATWFKNTSILSKKEGEVMVSVPNNFSREWLENKYNKLILKTVRNLEKGVKEIKYITTSQSLKIKQPQVWTQETDQLEFQELKVNKDTNLNPRYKFENFVVGPFNELPYAAASAITKSPGSVYNPLFIYGGVGLGKTHLIQAIGNEIVKNFSERKIKYISSEKFTSGIITAIKERAISGLKSAYQEIDVLIIDDIQFIAGKEKTQEEFFHIFNALYEKNKQVILSSDRPPKAIPALEERLRSRFEGGMIADISLPDLETRIAILKTKSQEKKINISDQILEYIASHIQRNIRELEGALNRLIAYQKLNNQPPDLNTIKGLLKSIINNPVKVTNHKKIIQAVAEFYDLKEEDLLCKSRKKEIVKPRQIAMYLLRTELKGSYPFIGRKFRGKDHTTAIYACNKVIAELEKDENLTEEVILIKQRIYSL
ncbi:MAG TPA: chromosomal replication initiator protein DnaA [Candidatus Parcubacteria bacterium]|nr:chromosomal replication initiator protein DnaA [Candidatus Parcubacteria bacterium]|tara:strand:- start:4941 stop:6287 length:1347 start_codon:yes stop_codon:yes gene_type:complete